MRSSSICKFLKIYEYSGYYIYRSEIRTVASFDKISMQDPNGDMKDYVNNFIFIHEADLVNKRLTTGSSRRSISRWVFTNT